MATLRAPTRKPVRGGWVSASPTTKPITPRAPSGVTGGGYWIDPSTGRSTGSQQPGSVWIGGPPGSAAPPPWAIGAPPPPNPTLTPGQQTAWAGGFASSSPPSGSWGGYNINTDPGVIGAQQQEQLGIQQLDADLAKSRREAIIRFGDPTLAALAGFGLDATDQAAAKQNYLSGNATLAVLDKGHQDRRNAIVNQLAAHGILGSGELGYQQGQENQTYGKQTYDARNSILDYLNQVNSQYLDRKNSLHQATLAALQSAYQFGLQNPQIYYGGTDGGSSAPSGTSAPSGPAISSDWAYQLQGRNQGYDPSAVYGAAQQQAPTYGGTQLQPHMIMNEGQVFTDPNGRRYIQVKYTDPTGRAGSSTEKVYV